MTNLAFSRHYCFGSVCLFVCLFAQFVCKCFKITVWHILHGMDTCCPRGGGAGSDWCKEGVEGYRQQETCGYCLGIVLLPASYCLKHIKYYCYQWLYIVNKKKLLSLLQKPSQEVVCANQEPLLCLVTWCTAIYSTSTCGTLGFPSSPDWSVFFLFLFNLSSSSCLLWAAPAYLNLYLKSRCRNVLTT